MEFLISTEDDQKRAQQFHDRLIPLGKANIKSRHFADSTKDYKFKLGTMPSVTYYFNPHGFSLQHLNNLWKEIEIIIDAS